MAKIKYKVHHVLTDPREDEFGNWWLLCKVEDTQAKDPKDVMFDDELPFISLDAAYKFKSHFQTSLEPIVFEFDEIEIEGNIYDG